MSKPLTKTINTQTKRDIQYEANILDVKLRTQLAKPFPKTYLNDVLRPIVGLRGESLVFAII